MRTLADSRLGAADGMGSIRVEPTEEEKCSASNLPDRLAARHFQERCGKEKLACRRTAKQGKLLARFLERPRRFSEVINELLNSVKSRASTYVDGLCHRRLIRDTFMHASDQRKERLSDNAVRHNNPQVVLQIK